VNGRFDRRRRRVDVLNVVAWSLVIAFSILVWLAVLAVIL
jgi:hypothetical protein